MKPSFRSVLALLASALALTARAETVVLTVASFPNLDASARAAIPRWEKEHPGVKIKLVSEVSPDHHMAMLNALASGVNVPDVIGVDNEFIARFAESGGLEDPGGAPYDGKPLLSKLLEFTGPQATSGTGILAAIPTDVGPGTLFYRKDILDRAGVSEAELTRSWESFIAAGKKIRAATGAYLLGHASDIHDVYIRTNLKQGDGVYFDGTGKILVESPRFQGAFELARAARLAGIDTGMPTWMNEWAEGLRRSTIASQMSGAWMAGHLNTWLAPGTKGLWRAAQLPAGAFGSWGGSFYAIPKKAEHKREAWEFVRFMCFDKGQQLTALRTLDAWPALQAAQDDPFLDQPVPFLGGQQARQLWKVAAARIPGIAVNKLDPLARQIVNAELAQVLGRDKDIKQALADARQQIEGRIH